MIAWWWLVGVAWGTCTFPANNSTLQQAVTACNEPILDIGPGTWEADVALDKPLIIRGASRGETVLVSSGASAFELTGLLSTDLVSFESLTIECGTRSAVVQQSGMVEFQDVLFTACDTLPAGGAIVDGSGASVSLNLVEVLGGAGAGRAVDLQGPDLSVSDLTIGPGDYGEGVLYGVGGSWDLADLTVDGAVAGTPLLQGRSLDVVTVTRARLQCNTAVDSALDVQADAVSMGPVLAWKNQLDGDRFVLRVDNTAASGVTRLEFLTLVGSLGDALLEVRSAELLLSSSAFVGGTHGLFAPSTIESTSIGFNLFHVQSPAGGTFTNDDLTGAGTSAILEEPAFVRLTEAQDCSADVLAPSATSPMVDAGSSVKLDRDGTRADIGATGGPEGFELDVDADGDGFSAFIDCNDADPDINPGATEDLSEQDLDCDGHTDPAVLAVPKASCASGGGTPSPTHLCWLALAVLATMTRRANISRISTRETP